MLVGYALDVYRQLQNSEEVGFQSLNVSGRLDIGIAPDEKGFFVNELTRWYCAHQFADALEAPHDGIRRAYMRALPETLGARPRGGGVVVPRTLWKEGFERCGREYRTWI
ncbi:hypothetical protein BDW02DRAFT_571072 [Decorospora gaudefroyi]|uniref:Uncharacterized protein n=1 Tax=Decorospora gaudefroyi TaxID=184978 RepID=A0A6A5K801_9PLEO|nr:hypothetical protein BDW02DRAFT_571072 [Decorospora gaudefroyi]